MNEFPFQNWMERTVNYPGVMACGLLLPNQHFSVKTCNEAFPEASMSGLLQSIAEVVYTLHNNRLGCSRLRWTFENAQIHSAQGPDGAIAVLVTTKDPSVAPTVEEYFDNFLGASSVVVEMPGQIV
jgi:hypothetical protein